MPFQAIRTTIFPDWWGRPSAFEVAPPVLPSYNERTFYAGSVALLLAVVALVSGGAWRSKSAFVGLGVVGLAVPLHAPGLYWLATHLPVVEVVQSQRMHFIFAFAVAVLAAFGLQGLLELSRGARLRLLVPLAALALAVVAVLQVDVQPGDVTRVLRHFWAGVDFPSASVVALTSIAWFVVFALAIGIAFVLAWRWPERRRAVAACVVLLAMGDALHFAHGYQPMGPEASVVPPVTPAIAYLERHAQGTRVVGIGGALPNDWSLTYGFDDVRGYDPPQPTRRFLRVWQLANPEQSPWKPFWLEDWTREALQVVSVLGAGYIVAPPEARSLYVYAPALRTARRVYEGPDAVIFRNPNAVPRAMLGSSVALPRGEVDTINALNDSRFDPRTTVVVERDQPGVAGLGAGRPHGTVTIVRDGNASVTLRATLDRRGLVVLNDNWAPGWTVRVDGRRAAPVRVNGVMRGVVVDRGRHEVTWRYAVPGLRLGAALSLLGLAFVLAAIGTGAYRRRASARSAGVRSPT